MSPLSRREFVAAGVAAGAGLIIGFYLPHKGESGAAAFSPNAYLRITADDKVTIVVPRSEMGQGVYTALPMILAEELEADWKQIAIEQPGASRLYGLQDTGGSSSVHNTWDPLRKAGATAREMLISAAALTWGVPRSTCVAESGGIKHTGSNRRSSYGELVAKASTLAVPTDVPLKQSKDYKIVGQRLARLDTPAKVKGEAVFGIDFHTPGMKYALLSRCPTIAGKVASFDDKESRKVGGVSYVGKVSDSAVAVVADSVWGAMEGRRLLNVNWDDGPNKDLNSVAITAALRQGINGKSVNLYAAGDVKKVSGKFHTAEYELPMMAHAAMEPSNCTADVNGSRCELWAPTQVPQTCRDKVAEALGLDPDQVKVNVTLMGGGFGRRLDWDYAVEAARVSKAIAAPVKVLWTREDDMRCSSYRPASFHRLSAALDGAGWPVAFTHRFVAGSINGQRGTDPINGADADLPDEAALIYSLPNASLDWVNIDTPVPMGFMRSVYGLQVAFASESFIDELAVAAGKDPLQYRLHLLSKDQDIQYFTTTWHTARMRGALQLVAEKAGWDKPLPAGHYRGVACFGCFGTYAAEVVEITMDNNQPRVHRVVVAVDCGQVVNPRVLEQQIQGGVVFALANALRAKITIDKGRIVQGNFDDYAPLRMDEAPVVEVYPVPSTEAPTGVGEPPVPPLAPALCNAIYAATKKRIRSLPILG
jgi:CO/xanthine dehydrogenase Mo-binding subunit